MSVCVCVASFETFGSGSFGGPLGVRWSGEGGGRPRRGLEGEPRSGSNF